MFNQTKYISKYIKDNYDTISFRVRKGDKKKIENYVKENGHKNMSEYIKKIISNDSGIDL